MTDSRRTYHQHCGLARGLDVVGERWTLLVVRELLLGPRRYGDLLDTLEGITTNLLAKRLREMTKAGLVQKVALPPPASGTAYALTEAGAALEPVVMELARWGGRLLAAGPRRGDHMNIGWALLSMKRRYPGGASFSLELVAGDRVFDVTFAPDRLGVREGVSPRAAVRAVAADQEAFFDVFFRGVPSGELEGSGALRVEGDRERWRDVLRFFAPPTVPGGAPRQNAVSGRA